jgi:hypothetical protein
MNLETALDVKDELESIFAVRTRGGRGRRFAFGVATPVDDGGYRIAVRAPAEQDLPADTLDLIRRRTDGELEVRFTGTVSAIAAHAFAIQRGLAIGASVGHVRSTAGTLGFFARKKDGTIGFVSNNHVLAADDLGKDGDEIVHPAPSDEGRAPRRVVGRLDGSYPRLRRPDAPVDCAFARLIGELPRDPGLLPDGRRIRDTSGEPFANPSVAKVGRTTGLTWGRVSAFSLGQIVHYSFGPVYCPRQIEIESINDESFSLPGDSGALVLCSDRNPIGLVFAASPIGGYSNCGYTYANPIDAVLRALNVTILT